MPSLVVTTAVALPSLNVLQLFMAICQALLYRQSESRCPQRSPLFRFWPHSLSARRVSVFDGVAMARVTSI